MADNESQPMDETLFDVVDRIRSQQFPHLDRGLVRDILRLHAEPSSSETELSRSIDELIFARTGE